MDTQATTPFGHCPSMAFLHVWPHCANARRNICQDLNSFSLENWRRPPGRPCTTWMKTIQQDLKSNNLSAKEAISVVQNRPLWILMCIILAQHIPSGACHKREEDSDLSSWVRVVLTTWELLLMVAYKCARFCSSAAALHQIFHIIFCPFRTPSPGVGNAQKLTTSSRDN